MIKKLSLHFLEGNQVIEKFLEEEFLTQFHTLFLSCPYKTIFQSPPFIKCWYENNLSIYHPVVIIQYEKEEIVGALCLAIKKDPSGPIQKLHSKIVGAGDYDAEYQTWLVQPDQESAFLSLAIQEVFAHFPKSTLVLKYLPYAHCLEGLINHPNWNKIAVVETYHRPLLQMNHPNFKEVYKKRHLKAKLNRFKKAGIMDFEEVVELNRFIEILDEVMALMDLRQLAFFNKMPSQDHPNKKALFIDLFKQNLLHVTVLKLNDDIASCIIGMKDGEWMHLSGLITFSPFYSKLSPGLVNLYLLGQLLEKQGYQYFDLTPGDDGYKERISSNNDKVYELTISQNFGFLWKRKIRKKFHQFLRSNGIRPKSFQLSLQKQLYYFKHELFRIFKNSDKNILTPDFENHSNEKEFLLEFEKNNIKHLLLYQDSFGKSRWNFFEHVFAKIEEGAFFLTLVKKNYLVCCIWIEPSGEDLSMTEYYVHSEWKTVLEKDIQIIINSKNIKDLWNLNIKYQKPIPEGMDLETA
jgi:CelD/BcsL family acetyltransferase involved in cellulose biosynthesis